VFYNRTTAFIIEFRDIFCSLGLPGKNVPAISIPATSSSAVRPDQA